MNNTNKHLSKLALFVAASCATLPAFAQVTSAQAAGLNLGTDTNYSLIDLGNATTLGWNSGPEVGNALVGNGVTVSTSGGGGGTEAQIPLPAAVWLLLSGVGALGLFARRKVASRSV